MAPSKQTMNRPRRPNARAGITLVEMLVSIALLVLMMTIIVQVFAGATGAVSTAKAFADIDQNLRKLSSTIQKDLTGVTAKFTPPLDPKDNLGYFEYGENSFADLQGEDCDDYMRFTVKAPEGELFTGRVFTPQPSVDLTAPDAQDRLNIYLKTQPITITSQYAEVIYFLRNNNLYRRVLLIAPERQSSIQTAEPAVDAKNNLAAFTAKPFVPLYDSGVPTVLKTSWQGLNDLSAHPSHSGQNVGPRSSIVLNTLGDLTNRENRFAYSRFFDDIEFLDISGVLSPGSDSVPDDFNSYRDKDVLKYTGDGVPDYYPTLYPEVLGTALINESSDHTLRTQMANRPSPIIAFPYTFPGAYTLPDSNTAAFGWIHSPDPNKSQNDVASLNALNHNPLEFGDSLPIPSSNSTWWGFPTWRETMSVNWQDPVKPINQPNFLLPLIKSNNTVSFPDHDKLPPMTGGYRVVAQPFNDQDGQPDLALSFLGNGNSDNGQLWLRCWEDDLLMTGVRSFDIKAYDSSFGGYVDLGWGDDLRLYSAGTKTPDTPPFLSSTPYSPPFVLSPTFEWPVGSNRSFDMVNQTFAHEGRIPPLLLDHRLDAQFPIDLNDTRRQPPYPGINNSYTSNIGDDTSTVTRLRRVWDSWSTEYTKAPANGIRPANKYPVGPPFSPPVYPSYPPPYPAPLRGIRIQMRVVDPKNEHVKSLTVIQDFTDKL